MNTLERASKDSQSAVAELRVRSALNPMLWLCSITAPLFLGATWSFRSWPALAVTFAVVAIVPVLMTTAIFGYFAIYRPEKLQSEDYQLRQETIRMIGAKVSSIEVDPASLNVIATQTIRAIEAGQDRAV